MKRYYQVRLITGAMLSFLLVLSLAVGGIWLFSYRQMEKDTDDFIRALQEMDGEGNHSFTQDAPPPMFGYTPSQRRYLSGFYDIEMDSAGNISSVQQRGIAEDAEISVQEYVKQAFSTRSTGGKIGSYKYSILFREDRTARVILLDISIQLQALYNILRSAMLVGAVLTVILFLILLPVSSRMAKAFVRSSEKQKQFITDAGHDLKTPVAIIRSSLDVLELTQQKNKWTENIRSQVTRMERLVQQLMMMARLDETGEQGKPSVLCPGSIIQEELTHFLPALQQKGITVRKEIPDSIRIMGYDGPFRQMIGLLLDNAAQYTDAGGALSVSAQAEKHKVRISFLNPVDHLPAQNPEALTGRFVRGDSARTQKDGGSGIGLSAVKRIAEMHRGRVDITYPDQHTFLITVELPAAKG